MDEVKCIERLCIGLEVYNVRELSSRTNWKQV